METTIETKIAICRDVLDIARDWYNYGLHDAALELINDKFNVYINNKLYDRIHSFLQAALETNDIPICFYLTLLESSTYIKLMLGQTRVDLISKVSLLNLSDKEIELLNSLC